MRYRIETERYYDVYDSQRHDDVDEYDWRNADYAALELRYDLGDDRDRSYVEDEGVIFDEC